MKENKSTFIIIGVTVLVIALIFIAIYNLPERRNTNFSTPDYNFNNNEIDNNTDNDKEDDNDNENELVDCEERDVTEIAFKSEKTISKNYSYLIKDLDFSNKSKFYCYMDICSDSENKLLDSYKEDNEDTSLTSGFSDYVVEIKNNKVVVTITNEDNSKKVKTLNIKNPISVRAHFDVSDMAHTYTLDKSGNLYYDEKVIYKNIKDFTIFEGNNYIHEIYPSEGQNIVIGVHTKDNKLLVGNNGKYEDITKINRVVLTSDDGEFPDIYITNTKNYKYEKYNKKEITAKNVFIDESRIFIYTASNELLVRNLDNLYCNGEYKIYNEKKIKKFEYDSKNKSIGITYIDDSYETFGYLYGSNL